MSNHSPHFPATTEDFSFRKIASVFGLMSSSTILAIFFSASSMKVLAMLTGSQGMGVVGLYRNLAAFVGGILSFGFTNVIVQQVSISKKPEEVRNVVSASVSLSLVQFGLGILLSVFGGGLIARKMLGQGVTSSDVLCVQIVLVMAVVNVILGTVTSILRGQANLKWLTSIQVLTAFSSLVFIYPLIKLGNIGFALNVASGTTVGCVVGAWVILRRYPGLINLATLRDGMSFLYHNTKASCLIFLQTLVTLGTPLLAQTLINKQYGLDPLGNYNAAILVIDTGIMVLMSSVRSHFLPSLGKVDNSVQQAKIFNRMISFLLLLGVIGGLMLIHFPSIVIRILFSNKFGVAGALLPVFSFSLVGWVYVWCFNTLLLHKARHWQYVLIDVFTSASFIALTYLVCALQLDLVFVPLVYAISYALGGGVYALYVSRSLGRHYVDSKVIGLTVFGIFSLVFSYFIVRAGFVWQSLFVWSMLALVPLWKKRLSFKQLILEAR